jgi:uncharacterized protein (DUF2062 family)
MSIPVISITGIASAGFILFMVYEFLIWPGFGLEDPFLTPMNFGMIPVGLIFYATTYFLRRRQGINLSRLLQHIPPE